MLVDLSSIIHPIYHMSASEPDPDHCSQATVNRVHALATGCERVAVCCDAGRSFRHDVDPTYKANRPERDEVLTHQIKLAVEHLEADGFPVWRVPGFEADDLIASAAKKALARDADVVIVTADKDLAQLVGERVRIKSVRDGALIDAKGVIEKFGVRPDQMRDYLTIVGDSSDNIKGIDGLGPKRAQALLAKYQSLDALYAQLDEGTANGLTPGILQAVKDFRPKLETTRKLIDLRTDAEVPFEELLQPRPAAPAPPVVESAKEPEGPKPEPRPQPELVSRSNRQASSMAVAVAEPDVLAPAPVEWELQLDPRSLREAKQLAIDMFQSRMFSAYGTPQAVLSTIMVGRELGLPAMGSLRTIHNIEGKHGLSASLMVGLVLKSGLAEYFEPISFSDKEATFETHRKGARNPVRLTHTIEMAQTAGKVKADSGWAKNPTDMLVARAQARLARMVYPDLLAGLYTPEELAEMRAEARGAAA